MITLKQYKNEENRILPLIQGFWKAHSHYDQSEAEAREDLCNWTKPGHVMFFIQSDETDVGFAHLGSRGGKIDYSLLLDGLMAERESTGWEIYSSFRNSRARALAAKRFGCWKKS